MAEDRIRTPSPLQFSEDELMRYAQRLREMIRCKTVSVKGSYDDTEFEKLRTVVAELFPLVHENMEKLQFSDDCWIYRLKGRDPSRNLMLMSHHDVVAADGAWEHEPFAGDIADGMLWGRGTADTKTPLFAEFSALEELLEEGFAPACNVWLGSSHNEELGGDGIPKALEYFQAQGITFEVILDEGGAVIDPPLGGMKCEKCAMVAVHEKGRYTLNCTAAGTSGHGGLTSAVSTTPVERMAAFINHITTEKPFIRRLNPQVRAMFAALAPYCGFPMKQLLGNLWLTGGLLQRVLPKLNPQAGGLIGSTCTFNRTEGSSAAKVCTATALLRSVDEGDMHKDIDTIRAIAAKYGVEITIAEDSEYHAPADMTQPAYAYTMGIIGEIFPQYPAAPMILPAGTDARTLTAICPCVLRFAPITLPKELLAAIHAENERISLTSIAEAVVFYKHFLKNYK